MSAITPEDKVDPAAIGSDVSRDRRQYWARRFADLFIAVTGLNSGSFLTTEIVQKVFPVCRIATRAGEMLCKGGHGRLRWRAETFYSEEPETIRWLETVKKDGLLWDVGANVGLYGIYAAKVTGCKVLAFEPEAQNFALLIENIVLNNVQNAIEAATLPLTRAFGVGRLHVHALTKGGAYNQFHLDGETAREGAAVRQVQFGVSADDLIHVHGFAVPSHIKIDVDGNEPDIIAGAPRLLADPRLETILIEVAPNDPRHQEMIAAIEAAGFTCTSRRSNWESRSNRDKQAEKPQENMIFHRR